MGQRWKILQIKGVGGNSLPQNSIFMTFFFRDMKAMASRIRLKKRTWGQGIDGKLMMVFRFPKGQRNPPDNQ